MIRQFRVNNFRSFGKLDLRLGGFNVFIGANGSGKSNLIDAFKFLRDAVAEGLTVAVSRREGWQGVRCRKLYQQQVDFVLNGKSSMEAVPLELTEGKQETISDFEYDYNVSFLSEDGDYRVVHEEGCLTGKIASTAQRGEVSSFERGSTEAEVRGSLEPGADKRKYPVLRQNKNRLFLATRFFSLASVVIGREIEGWRFYYPDPEKARQPHRVEEVDSLSESGDNLALVLHQLEREASENSGKNGGRIRDQITAIMQQLVPGFEDWRTEQGADGRMYLKVKERPIRGLLAPSLVSDGTIRLLTMLTALLYGRAKPCTVFIEEPEHCLHPLVMQDLVNLMREVSKETQIVVTTHSPDFVRYCRPEEVFLMDKPKGFTHVVRAREIKDIDSFLTNFTLDQLWTMGYLQPRLPSL